MNLTIWKRILRTKFGLPLGLCILFQGVLFSIALPLLPIVISDKIGMDKSQVTLFFLLTTLAGVVVTLATGYLSDGAIARYKLILVCGAIGTLGYLGIATATQPIHVYISGLIGVAMFVIFPQIFAVIKDGVVGDWETEAQVMGITAMRTLFSFGFILGTGIASWLAQVMDIQAAFFLITGGAIALTAYGAVVMYQVEGHIARLAATPIEISANQTAEARGVILPMSALIIPLLALVVLQGAESTRRVYLSLVMFQSFNDASIAPLMFGITAAVELVMMGWTGYLASKIGEKSTIAIGALVGAAYFIVFSSTQSLPLLYLSNVWYAVFVAALLGVAMAYIQRLLSHRVGMGGSLYMAVLNVGSLVGILSPLLVEGYDQTIFVLPAILCIAGAGLLIFGDRTAQVEKRLRENLTVETPDFSGSSDAAGCP